MIEWVWLPVQKISSEVSANYSLSSLKRENFRTFSDIPRLATLLKNLLIQIQVKDEEWEEFVDMNSDGTSISLP